MTERLPSELQDRLEAKVVAEIESYFDDLEQSLKRELANIDYTRQTTIEAYKRQLKGTTNGNDSSQTHSLIQETVASQGVQIRSNGLHNPPNRREMLLEALPDFVNETFIRRDVEAKIVERWPQVEPKSKVEAKNFGSRIAGLLTDMVKKGQLEVTKGENEWDPRVYRLKADFADTLLKSGP